MLAFIMLTCETRLSGGCHTTTWKIQVGVIVITCKKRIHIDVKGALVCLNIVWYSNLFFHSPSSLPSRALIGIAWATFSSLFFFPFYSFVPD